MKRRTLIQCALAQFPLARPARCAADPLSWEAVMGEKWEAPAALRSFAAVHPRLFVTGKRIADLKRKIATSHQEVWEIVKENAGRYLGRATPSNFAVLGVRPERVSSRAFGSEAPFCNV